MSFIRLSSVLLLIVVMLLIGCGPSPEVIALSVEGMD